MNCPLCNSVLKETKSHYKCNECKLKVEKDLISKIKSLDDYYAYCIEEHLGSMEGSVLRGLEKTILYFGNNDLLSQLGEYAIRAGLDTDTYEVEF